MKRILALTLALLLLLLPLTGCKKESLRKVRLYEVTHSVFYAAQYIAMEKGYFADEGLEIELTNAGGADKAMAALLSDQADIALMGPEATVYVYNEGREDYTLVVGQLTACDGAFIVGREPNENFKLEDLRGKSILGGRAGGIPLMTLEYALKQAGMEPGIDVNVRSDVQFNLMAGAFTGGEGDYTTLFEPTATAIEEAGQGYVLESVGKLAGKVPYTCYQVTKSTLAEDEETVTKFLKAIYRAQQYLSTGKETELAHLLQPHFSDSTEEQLATVIRRYREIGAFAETPVLTQESYERLLDIMESAGELSARAPYAKIVDNSVAEKVMR